MKEKNKKKKKKKKIMSKTMKEKNKRNKKNKKKKKRKRRRIISLHQFLFCTIASGSSAYHVTHDREHEPFIALIETGRIRLPQNYAI